MSAQDWNRRILYEGFSLTIDSSERVGLIAPSGFGKTTLCKLIAGYEKPISGEILIDGQPADSYHSYYPVQMIWQHPETVVNPRIKMKYVLAEGDFCFKAADLKDTLEKRTSNESGDCRRADELRRIVDGLGIRTEWLERYPQELSGGELQRFCIARALGRGTKFILADEISTMLDLITQAQLWNFLLEEIERRGIGLLTVSHSPELLKRICTRTIDLTKQADSNAEILKM